MRSLRMSLVAALVLLVTGLTAAGCVGPGYHVGVMARLQRQGNCAGAIERAIQIQDRVPEMPLEKQAHYAIFRGACHLQLGQIDAAAAFLSQAQQYRAQYPMLIQGGPLYVLDQSLAGLAQVQAQMGVPAPPQVQVQVQVAPPPPAVPAEPAPAPQQAPPPPAVGVH